MFEVLLIKVEAVACKSNHDSAGVNGGVIFNRLHFLRKMQFVASHSIMFPLDLLDPEQQFLPLTLIRTMRGKDMFLEVKGHIIGKIGAELIERGGIDCNMLYVLTLRFHVDLFHPFLSTEGGLDDSEHASDVGDVLDH